MIVGGVAANLALIHGLSTQMHDRMDRLDQQWQVRLLTVQSDLAGRINDVAKSIPPDWFRAAVEKNTSEIERLRVEIDNLEDEVTRDFVRKDELPDALLHRDLSGD